MIEVKEVKFTVAMSFLDEKLQKVMSKMEGEEGFNEFNSLYELLEDTVNEVSETRIMYSTKPLDYCLNDYYFIKTLLVGTKSACNCLKLIDAQFVSELEKRLKSLLLNNEIGGVWEESMKKIDLLSS